MSIRWRAAPKNRGGYGKTQSRRGEQAAGAKAGQVLKRLRALEGPLFHKSRVWRFFRSLRGKGHFPGSAARVTINAGSSCPSSVARLVGVKVSSAVCLSISFEMDL